MWENFKVISNIEKTYEMYALSNLGVGVIPSHTKGLLLALATSWDTGDQTPVDCL